LAILGKAINEDSLLQSKNIELKETNALLLISGGDARKLLNIFELIVGTLKNKDIIITDELVQAAAQERVVNYDKDGDQHYDIISAFIKSIRGSDPNAAVYWLARMVEGGEDPKFIARRLIISASEDIGLANPNALLMANNCFNAVQVVGWPEARIILSQCVIYLASSPKGNAVYKAINEAQNMVRETGSLGVPLSLRNAPSKLMKELGHGDGYNYSHDYPNNFANQEFLPNEIIGTSFYSAGSSAKEKEVQEKINKLWGTKYSK
jgi:putative ATPase